MAKCCSLAANSIIIIWFILFSISVRLEYDAGTGTCDDISEKSENDWNASKNAKNACVCEKENGMGMNEASMPATDIIIADICVDIQWRPQLFIHDPFRTIADRPFGPID